MTFTIFFIHAQMDCLVCSHCFRYIGSIELQIGRKLFFDHLKSSSKTDDDENTSNVSKQSHSPKNCEITHTNSEKMKLNNDSTYQKSLEALMNGTLILPYSKKFRLPPVISCPGGCEEEHYCRYRSKNMIKLVLIFNSSFLIYYKEFLL